MLINNLQLVQAKYLYDPFGNTLVMSGPLAGVNSYRFSSKEWNANAGLYYYLYRFYDPNLQRWVNRDPIQELGFEITRFGNSKLIIKALHRLTLVADYDLYRFVRNTPIDDFDLFGLDDFSPPPGMPSGPMGPGTAACAWAEGQAQLAFEQAEYTPTDENIENSLYWSLVAAKVCAPPHPKPPLLPRICKCLKAAAIGIGEACVDAAGALGGLWILPGQNPTGGGGA